MPEFLKMIKSFIENLKTCDYVILEKESHQKVCKPEININFLEFWIFENLYLFVRLDEIQSVTINHLKNL